MPVARQPPHVRREHRPGHSHPSELPAGLLAGLRGDRERLRVPLRDPVIRSDIDDHTGPVRAAGEEIRRVPPPSPSVVPGQPERLGGHRHHRRVEVHQHHVVAFEPGLIPHVLTRRGEPPPTGEARHPLGEPERAHRRRALEPHPCAGLQRLPSRHAVRTDVVHGESNTWKIYNRFSGPTHQHPKITKKINGCNCSGKDNPDGIRSTGKGSDQMARDSSPADLAPLVVGGRWGVLLGVGPSRCCGSWGWTWSAAARAVSAICRICWL